MMAVLMDLVSVMLVDWQGGGNVSAVLIVERALALLGLA